VAGTTPFEGISPNARLLGTAGAIPSPKRRLSATLVRAGEILPCSTALRRRPGGGPAGAWPGLEAGAVTHFGPPLEDPSAHHLARATSVFPETSVFGRDGPTGTPTFEEEKQARGSRTCRVPRKPVPLGCTAKAPPPGAEIHSGQTPLLYGRNGIGKTISGGQFASKPRSDQVYRAYPFASSSTGTRRPGGGR
jgi:hypothetical protein